MAAGKRFPGEKCIGCRGKRVETRILGSIEEKERDWPMWWEADQTEQCFRNKRQESTTDKEVNGDKSLPLRGTGKFCTSSSMLPCLYSYRM